MTDIVFEKKRSGYISTLKMSRDRSSVIVLDTGSPITVISIPDILALTKESISTFRIKVEDFIDRYGTLDYGVYGSQMTNVIHSFIPYVVKEIVIGEVEIPRFMFWVDVTFYNKPLIEPTSILFGYDYVFLGQKHFDKEDNFHISIENMVPDTKTIGYALSNIDEEIREISSLMKV